MLELISIQIAVLSLVIIIKLCLPTNTLSKYLLYITALLVLFVSAWSLVWFTVQFIDKREQVDKLLNN